MTVTTRETLMQRAMKGKPLMGQELRDLIDTMFWLKNSPVKESVQVVKQEVGRSPAASSPAFPDVDGTGFVKIGDDRKWYTDPTQYLTRPQGDVFYFRNALFPMDPGAYLAGDRTFKNFADSARAAFTGGDGIDIVTGDIRVDNTVSRVGHIHDDRYYTETETDALIETRVPKHRFPINDDGTYNVVPSYANRQITLTPTGSSFGIWINGTWHSWSSIQNLPQHPNVTATYFYFLDENGVFQLSTTPFELLKVAPVAIVMWNATKGEGRWVHEFHTTRMSARTHERLHAKGAVPVVGGFNMSGFTLNVDTPAAVSFGVAGGILWDEDIKHQIPALADGGPYEVWYRTGAAGDWTWDSVSTLPYKYGATYFTVNKIVTGAWTQVEINTGGVATWGNLFVLATPHNGGVSIICVQGQNIYTDAASATAESWDALDKGGMPFPEYFALYRVTYKASVAYSGVTGRVRIEKVTSVAQGGESGVSGATVHNSLGGRDALDAHPALAITDVYNLANGVLLKKISTGLVAAVAADLPAHASRHYWDGTDPITGQSLSGLRPSDVPTFSGIRSGSVTGYLPIRGNDGVEIARFNSSGFISYGDITLSGNLSIANLSGILYAANGLVRVAVGADLPSHTHLSFDISDSGNAGRSLLQQSSIEDARSYLQLTGWATKNFTNGSTTDVAEGANLYYTDSRARAAITATTPIIMAAGIISHSVADGNLHVPATGTTSNAKYLKAGSTAGSISWQTLYASDLPSHTHYSDQISDSTVIGRQILKATDAPSIRDALFLTEWATKAYTDGSTTDVSEGSNLYYTDARARAAITAAYLPSHASTHHAGGTDPLAGQSIAGLRMTDAPRWGAVGIVAPGANADLDFRANSAVRRMTIRWYETGDRIEIFTSNDDGSSRADRILIPRASSAPVTINGGLNLTSGGIQITGTDAITSGRGGRFSDLIVSGQTTLSTSLNGLLKATAGVIGSASASDLPSHTHTASQISNSTATGRSILLAADQASARTAIGVTAWATKAFTNGSTTDVAEGSNLYYTDTRARAAITATTPIIMAAGIISHSTADGYHHVPATGTTNNGKFLKAGATEGTESWQTLVVGDLPSHGSTHEFGGADPIVGQNLPGLRISDTPVWRSLDLIRALGSTIDGATKIRLLNNDSSYGGALWMDSAANMRMAFFQNDATWTDRYTFGRNGNLNILSGALQLGSVDTITSGREGRFTGLRLSNIGSGQIPVASGANGQITASGLTDDGTYFTSNRIFRSHNSLTKSGNTWTALQWSQGTTIRTTMLSSDGSGASACHALTMVPASTETANEDLGFLLFGQRLSGKSGTNPGLKLAASGRAVGSGGSTGGFGGQLRFEYRPDNGANLVDALRIGAFGGSTADAVEAEILLRITAGAQVPAITSKILKTSSNGTLQGATENTDYLPVNNPTSTGVLGANVTKHTVRTYVGGARTIDPGLTPKFQKQTGTGTITLPTASAIYEGLEYKITFHGRFNVTFDTPSGMIYTLAAGASYWYDVESTTVSAGDASGENCSCDLWCDGSNWYIRW